MSIPTFSLTEKKRSRVELVVDRHVVDRAVIDSKNPVAVFVAEYADPFSHMVNGESYSDTVARVRRESNIRVARMLWERFCELVSEIDKTDHKAADALLNSIADSMETLAENVTET